MPTLKPRLAITLSPEVEDTIRRLASLERVPMSRVVVQLLEHVMPQMQGIVAALEAARDAKGKPAQELLTALTRMQGAVEQAASVAVDQVDMFSGEVARVRKAIKRKPRKAPKKAAGKVTGARRR
jgi:hypothetical protein